MLNGRGKCGRRGLGRKRQQFHIPLEVSIASNLSEGKLQDNSRQTQWTVCNGYTNLQPGAKGVKEAGVWLTV